MKPLIEILNEQQLKFSTYYHGTSNQKAGEKILQEGIKPGRVTTSRKQGAPVANKVYMTPNLKQGIIYCLGANMLGKDISSLIKYEGQNGYLFSISKNKLINDLQPDEDDIGYLLNYLFKGEHYGMNIKIHNQDFSWLKTMAKNKLTYLQLQKLSGFVDNDYQLYAIGKKLVKFMNTEQKLQLINSGANVAHSGIINPEHAWKFNKLKSTELEENGLNFFELAEQIK